MATVVKGQYVVWGVSTTISAGAATTGYITGVRSRRAGDMKEIKNAAGNVATIYWTNDQIEVDVDVTPTAATDAAATNLYLPARGAEVTLVDASEGTGPTIAGKFYFMGGEITKTNEGEARYTMNLRRFIDTTLPAQT